MAIRSVLQCCFSRYTYQSSNSFEAFIVAQIFAPICDRTSLRSDLSLSASCSCSCQSPGDEGSEIAALSEADWIGYPALCLFLLLVTVLKFCVSLSRKLSHYFLNRVVMDSYALMSVLDLPPPFRSTFSFRYFNSLQSECFPICFSSDVNMVISAPTGSGKTVLFELCILRLLSRFISNDGRFNHLNGTLKTIYIAPSKALVQEKLRDWSQKFGSWGIMCLELTGDNEAYNMRNIQEADIILTTPEKFDSVTRYPIKDGSLGFFSDIALLLIDEVHLLNDPRGAALEAVVSRTKMLSRKPEMKSSPLATVRFLAVSATIPNIEDLAEWLMAPPQGIKRFGEEMRPVKLTTKVFGYTPAKNDFLFEKRLQIYIFDLLMQYSKGKSALVFCSTRKGAQEAAQQLSQTAMTFGYSNPFIKSRDQQERLREASLSCSDKQMQSYIIYGIGYHNGGLCSKDRTLVEGLFLKGDIQVLCTTNTLAHGINLPAHTVIIKSTQYFNKEKGMYMEYERSMITQMCGRAGRPPFDDTGMVIIMTRRETVHLYENLLNGCEMVESQFLPCMTEHLTAEIVQLTVTDITHAIEWMKCSYLYVRMKKSPATYAVKKATGSDSVERHMQDICVQKINELSKYQMIWNDEDGFLLKPLEPGRLMTKYYLKFDTMKYIMQTPFNCSLEDALHVVCRAEEISWMQLRRNEKKLLNDINIDKPGRLRYHVLAEKGKRKKRIQTREEKIFVLANDCLTGDPMVHDLSLIQDMNSICSNGCRIAKSMKEFFIYKKNYKGVINSSLLAKSLFQKLWDDSPYLLKQLPGIGMVTAKALHSMGVTTFDALEEADPRRIEMVTGRKYPFGNTIKESLQSLPSKVEMMFEEAADFKKQRKSKLLVTLTRLSEQHQSAKRHFADLVIGVEEDNLILAHEKISPYTITVFVSYPPQGKLVTKADLIFEEYIGMDIHRNIVIVRDHEPSFTRLRGGYAPKEVHIIEDVNDTYRVGVKPVSSSDSKEDNSMPSFNLIDEPLDEVEPAALVEAEDEEECRILSEKEVFNHIREKAINFPILNLNAEKTTCLPSAETLNIKRKRILEKKREMDGVIEVPRETKRKTVTQQDLHILSPDTLDLERNALNTSNISATEKSLNGETVFDHIRNKAKSFQWFDQSSSTHYEQHQMPEKYSFWTDSDLSNASTSCLKDSFGLNADMTGLIEAYCQEEDTVKKNTCSYGSTTSTSQLLDPPRTPKPITSPKVVASPLSSLYSDVDTGKLHCGRFTTKQTQVSPRETMPCHSLESASQPTKEVDSLFGFKSVFSFL